MDQRLLNRLPIAGVLVGTALLAIATAWYPGGYRWSQHTISALFQSAMPSGDVNPARPLAVMGVLTAMSGVGLLFHLVSSRAPDSYHKRAIQIAGIAATVFAALTVVLLHDLMVGLALVCFMVAIIAVLHLLYKERAIGLVVLGVLFLAMELGTAVLYFGRTFLDLLPWGQKAALLLIGLWLFAVERRSRLPRTSPIASA